MIKFPHQQQGSALMILMLIFLLIAAAVLFSELDGSTVKIKRDKETNSALAEAKAALIGYALSEGTKPGTLPCTDNDNDGSANTSGSSSCKAFIGHLPSKQLDIPMLRDSYGECLWYALSPAFRNQMSTANRKLNPINSNTPGTITLVNDNEVPLGSVNPVIAVVFAPNNPVNGQSRSGAVTTNYCPGDFSPGDYLDARGAVNNATGNVAGNNYTFKLGKAGADFNDQLVYITAKEFYSPLRKRIAHEIVGDVDVISGLFKYYKEKPDTYPCPAKTVDGDADCSVTTGFVPYNNGGLQYTALLSWLTNNGWFAMTTYQYITPTHIKVTLADAWGSFSCEANANVVTCAAP